MKVAMIGSGYVGLVTGAVLADRGNMIRFVDKNPEVVSALSEGRVHIFEPGLEEMVRKNHGRKNFMADDDTLGAVEFADVIFLTVNTPSNGNGSFNLGYLKQAAKEVGEGLRATEDFKVVVGKSTVPQGTHKVLVEIIAAEAGDADWAYVSNPETLAEGSAIADFSKPERIIIGTDSEKALKLMRELYHPFNQQRDRIIPGSPASAELAKLFSNTALAMKVAMVNECARVTDTVPGADMSSIRRMMCEDPRIGYKFMFPSPGYGGSCFPKDVQGMVAQAREQGYDPLLLSKIHESNEAHKEYLGERVAGLLKEESPRIAVWGVTFKPNTDDMRDAASIPILTALYNRGAEIMAYDPQPQKAEEIFGDKVSFVPNRYDAVEGADALVLLTEWREFDVPDFAFLKEAMRGNQLFDLRNRWRPESANREGFDYVGIGRNYPLEDKKEERQA